ncbi:GNAT family N-acetyltransferase [Spirulina sp. 06S082]|uniref:GNAT family N-acetyltransferase n=1 Tax=Spirulina sp. 06S082 TaxID=3110248 RepID=UPI002B1EA312|nr:GNAT family N-acetyltransferase [Spirulina sp. 06S082]MEA5471108.1 GNAT family N-acetyltransferase [Spirulina sp. 06S082]
MDIRKYETTDAEAIAAVYRDAVINIGCDFYNAKQVEIWSSFSSNIEEFRQKLNLGLTLIAVVDRKIVSFGQLYPEDRIAFLYTSQQYARQGYAKAIYQQLAEYAMEQNAQYLTTEASRVSQFFFLKQGFQIVEPEIVIRQGIEFERFKMRKEIA